VTNTAETPDQGSDAWFASCVEYVAYDERDTKACMWFNAEMYTIMLRGILLPGLVTNSFSKGAISISRDFVKNQVSMNTIRLLSDHSQGL
jgi:hypothetical protein